MPEKYWSQSKNHKRFEKYSFYSLTNSERCTQQQTAVVWEGFRNLGSAIILDLEFNISLLSAHELHIWTPLSDDFPAILIPLKNRKDCVQRVLEYSVSVELLTYIIA